jgi:hypothetical protein
MGYLQFNDGDTVTASALNTLMSQCLVRFATVAERNAAYPTPTTGKLCYLIGTGVQLYAQGSWRTIFPEGGPVAAGSTYSRFTAANNTQAISSGSWNRVLLGTTVINSGAWTPTTVSPGTTFTCQVAGRYGLSGFFRYVTASAASRGVLIADGAGASNYVTACCYNVPSANDQWTGTVYGERTFAVGDTCSLWAWSNASGITAATDVALPYLNIRQIP